MSGSGKKSRKAVIALSCCAILFAAAFITLFIKDGYMDKLLARYGLRERKTSANWSARGWNKCLTGLGVDCDAAFLGDSLTYGGDFSACFPGQTVCNLGVPTDTLAGMTERAYLLETVKPEKVFILGGINGLTNYNIDLSVRQYEGLLSAVRSRTNAEIFLISVLPVSAERSAKGPCSNDTILLFNQRLAGLAKDNGLTYIDLHSLLAEDGAISPQYTTDGLHLTEAAYAVWAEAISAYMGTPVILSEN